MSTIQCHQFFPFPALVVDSVSQVLLEQSLPVLMIVVGILCRLPLPYMFREIRMQFQSSDDQRIQLSLQFFDVINPFETNNTVSPTFLFLLFAMNTSLTSPHFLNPIHKSFSFMSFEKHVKQNEQTSEAFLQFLLLPASLCATTVSAS